MASSLGQLAFGLAATAAVYPLTREVDNYVSNKRKSEDSRSFSVKRLKLSTNKDMAFRSRRSFRRRPRRFRRRFRKRRMPFRRRRFTRAVRRVILRTSEPKQVWAPENVTGYAIREGDGTSRVINVSNPPAAPIQGVEDDQYIGNKYFLKGIALRGQVGTSGEVTNRQGCLIRVTLVWSKEQAPNLFGAWTEFTSATTSTAAPLQTPPDLNPRFFAITNGTQEFVGNGWAIPFDRTRVRVISSKTIVVNPGVDNEAGAGIISMPTAFSLYFKVNKWMQIEDNDQSDMSSSLISFKYGTYYLVMQAVSNTNDVTDQTIAEMDYSIGVFYRDP
ncbi:putative capsid protein [Sewage-associated circular DNA virus-3]|uniref:putative capsid protein n=1 Tax=Sewage-associated circular DNA virus-3 TaxID=1519392 RepID=UPI0004D1C5BE|nr:putative capsid protein [Sewage-associated circular DNA virus-3]AIF34809.1 putative capsid protein [Sewage-associated circular DNA virus-3]